MFNPAQITTYVSLAAAGIWAICYVRNSKKIVVLATLAVTLGALGSSAYLEATQHADPCANAPTLRLNEICAAGEQCQGGKDFVEIFNPTSSTVNLACYAIGDMHSVRGGGGRVASPPHLLTGDIGGKAVRAWNEEELGLHLSWRKGDEVTLYKLKLAPGQNVAFDRIERAQIDESQSYLYRHPDGSGELQPVSSADVEARGRAKGKVGSFDRPNLPN